MFVPTIPEAQKARTLHDASCRPNQRGPAICASPPANTVHIGRVIFVATSTPKIVAVFRTLPEIVMSASDTGGCCSASITRRSLTLWSCSTSRRMASIGMSRTAGDFAFGDLQACPGDYAVDNVLRAIAVQGV